MGHDRTLSYRISPPSPPSLPPSLSLGTSRVQVPITIDDDYRVRVLDPEKTKRTEQLAGDCKAFVDSESQLQLQQQ